MRPKHGERIGMAPVDQSIDLRFEMRVLCRRGGASERRGRWLFFVRHGDSPCNGCPWERFTVYKVEGMVGSDYCADE